MHFGEGSSLYRFKRGRLLFKHVGQLSLIVKGLVFCFGFLHIVGVTIHWSITQGIFARDAVLASVLVRVFAC